MKLPTMTKGKQWLWLLMLIVVEGALAFVCYQAGTPLSYLGLVLVVIANVEWIAATIIALMNAGKKTA
jgi:hypothetical protein